MGKKVLMAVTLFLALVFLTSFCATSRLERRLDPQNEEFFNKVRYIITKEESKIFLELPPSARAKFSDEFWKRRDPTPETETNEYKEAYYARIEEANRLFKGGGRPGWLQDRGRIYILFGPPNERQTNPMGGQPVDPYEDPRRMIDSRRVATGEKPTEVWVYYNLFSSLQKPQAINLVFVDTGGTGDYKLTTNIDEVIPGTMGAETVFRPDLALSHELQKEESLRTRLNFQRALFDFSWEFIKEKNKELESNLLIRINLPYKNIIFAKEEDRFKAELELEIQVRNIVDEVIWKFENVYNLEFREEFLNENKGGGWEAEIPVRKWLEKGSYSVYLLLRNSSGEQEVEKLLPLKI